jgi:hypothetical protein
MEEDHNIQTLKSEMREVKEALNRVADALVRLTVLEERHAATQVLQTRIVERLDRMDALHTQREIENARTHDVPNRVAALEAAFRELHIEREAEKSSLRAYHNSAKIVWTVVAFVATSGWGMALWQFISNKAA